MNAELDQLYYKIQQLADLCRQLRQENNQLKQTVQIHEQTNQVLEQRLHDARVAIETLIARLPAEEEV